MAKFSRKQLASYIAAQIRSGADPKKLAATVATLLVSEKRSRELPQLMRDVRQIRLSQDGVLEVDAVSARRLSQTHTDQISALFAAEAKKVIVHQSIDKDLIGGVRVETADSAADLSVRGKLENLYRSIA